MLTDGTRISKRVLLSWSSGKDSAWALHVLRQQDDVEVVGLLSSFNEAADRVSMHAVRRELAQAQADAAGLPLWPVMLPWPCSNEAYEDRMQQAINRARENGVTHVAFGDLFLSDIREYRIRQMSGTGIEPLFPIWSAPERTPELARQMLAAGLRAIITCVDPKQLDESFVGREFDAAMLDDLPAGADPCGENGEFHTYCYAGPAFDRKIDVRVGEIVRRNGFIYADVAPVGHTVTVESFTDSLGREVPCERYETVIGVDRIVHGPELRVACQECPRYGLTLGCPPHGPTFEEHAAGRAAARVICLRVPIEMAGTRDPEEVHEWALRESRSFLLDELRVYRDAGHPVAAGGSCDECEPCAAAGGETICPNPETRIPSLSALGVNVIALVKTCFGISLEWGETEFTCSVGAVLLNAEVVD